MNDDQIDYVPHIEEHFPLPWPTPLTPIAVSQSGTTLTVLFEGRRDVRVGRFGVHIVVPARIGDERWHEFFGEAENETDPSEWAKMAVILEIEEVYDTRARGTTVQPDADGIIWLS